MDSIPNIKRIFETVNIKEYPTMFEIYENDKRIGVQKLLRVYKNKFQKNENKIIKFQNMKFYENKAYANGFCNVVGIDEVGRGCFAGPVVTSGVMLPQDFSAIGIDDSKKLKEAQREYFFSIISTQATEVVVNFQDNHIIDEINILNTTKKSMLKVIDDFITRPDFIIIDAVNLDTDIKNISMNKADEKSISVASASIIAKVTRDNFMFKMHEIYPQYNFAQNKGYGTQEHIMAIKKYGICPIHRKTFLKNLSI